MAYEDGKQMEAHKVFLASSSPFFQKILKNSKHPHPLIYLRGFQSKNFVSILDFLILYFGEANVYQEDLDSFLAIAPEIQLKGLTGQTNTTDLVEEQDNPIHKRNVEVKKSTPREMNLKPREIASNNSTAIATTSEISASLQALDEKVKSMMEKGEKLIPNGKHKQAKSSICKVCGKEGHFTLIRHHIEVHHIKGISIPCGLCDKTFSSRGAFNNHKSRPHK